MNGSVSTSPEEEVHAESLREEDSKVAWLSSRTFSSCKNGRKRFEMLESPPAEDRRQNDCQREMNYKERDKETEESRQNRKTDQYSIRRHTKKVEKRE